VNERVLLLTALVGAAAFGALAERTYRRVILPGSGVAQLVLVAGSVLQTIAGLAPFASVAPWLQWTGTAAMFAGAAGILVTRDRPLRSAGAPVQRDVGGGGGSA